MPVFISTILQQHPDAGYWHQQYPWFSIGQLVHTANEMENPVFTKAAQRTAVFFNDIPRLHWLLHQQEVEMAALQAFIHAGPEIATDQSEINNEVQQADKQPEKEEDQHDKIAVDEISVEPDSIATAIDKLVVSEMHEPTAEENHSAQLSSVADEVLGTEAANTTDEQAIEQSKSEENNVHQPDRETLPEEVVENETVIPHFHFTESETTDEAGESDMEEPDIIPLPVNLLSESLAQAAGSFKSTLADEENFVFKTAYQHTIDYFASQGIKLDGEPAKDDRFGQQLKTFTSWLRQMKRLPDTPVSEADPLVESQAAHSLQKGDVLTEPMADVLLKQGKQDQAIRVLQKLRLLHPSKSHYFAARIDQIKHST